MTLFWLLLAFAVVIYLILQFTKEGTALQDGSTVQKEKRHFFTQLHGLFHNNADGTSRQSIIRRCREGEEVQFIREVGNPRDPNAIKVCRMTGEQLGYVSAEQAQRLAADMDSGWTYRVNIDEIYPFEDKPRKRGVRLRVTVLTMSRVYEARRARKNSPRS